MQHANGGVAAGGANDGVAAGGANDGVAAGGAIVVQGNQLTMRTACVNIEVINALQNVTNPQEIEVCILAGQRSPPQGETVMVRLTDTLPRFPLKELIVDNFHFSMGVAQNFLRLLRKLPLLQRLRLSNNKLLFCITDIMFELEQFCFGLVELEISHNYRLTQFEPGKGWWVRDMELFVRSLSLARLSLKFNLLGNYPVKMLGWYLSAGNCQALTSKHLKVLDLSGNCISKTSSLQFIFNCNLEVLLLGHNNLGRPDPHHGIQKLATLLPQMQTLRRLDLESNGLSPEQVHEVQTMVANNAPWITDVNLANQQEPIAIDD